MAIAVEDKLEKLLRRGRITAAQSEAGRLWRDDWLEGGAGLASLEHGRTGSKRPPSTGWLDMRAVARDRFRQASAALGAVRAVCFAIVVEERDTAEVALELGEPRAAILPMVRQGLTVLVDFYQLSRFAVLDEVNAVSYRRGNLQQL